SPSVSRQCCRTPGRWMWPSSWGPPPIARNPTRIVPRRRVDVRTEDERERGFDAQMRQMFREHTDGSSSACLDAETLAAWSAGALPSVEARTVESHLASCGTCSAMFAAFSRADVEHTSTAAVAVPLWRRWRLQWLMPIAA